MVSKYGNLFYQSVELWRLCCKIRKVEPLNRVLSGLYAWICGLRREQAVTRAEVKKIEIDKAHGGIIKVNPLSDWAEKQVWDYIKENGVPYNTLHDQAIHPLDVLHAQERLSIRAGRWWWETPEQKECGLHCMVCPTPEKVGEDRK